MVICLGGTVAHADEPPRHFDIPASKASEGLALFAEQSGIPLIYLNENVRNKRTNRVAGSYTVSEALEILLIGTGIDGSFNERRVLTVTMKKSGDDVDSEFVAEIDRTPAGKGETVKKRGLWASVIAVLAASAATDVKADQASEAKVAPTALNEIVVTAQKREERLQDVPISISVLNGEDLDRSTGEGIAEALSRVPGLATTTDQQGGSTLVTVRGVTAGLPQQNGSSPVAYYLDSVPFGFVKSAGGPDSNVYDLERVEVLRGPQGTLYGASALNGVVRILTHDADLHQFEFKTRASLSSTERGNENYRADMAVNVPLIAGKFAARAVAGYESLSGWIDRPSVGQSNANDSILRNARLKLSAQPTEDLSIGMSAWLSRVDYDQLPLGSTPGLSTAPISEPASTDYDVYGAEIGYDFSAFTVASTTSYVDFQNEGELNIAANSLFTGLSSDVFAQEVLVNSAGGEAWRWSLGAMYRDAEDRYLQTLPAFLPVPIDFSNRSESLAIFGELTRLFLDGQLELTVGLRHFEDDVTQQENVRHTGVPTEPLYHVETSFDADSPRVVLTWHPSKQFTVYGSYAEGFRSGFDQDADIKLLAPDLPPVEADTLMNYELGAKGSSWGGRLSFDAAVYYAKWEDLQQPLAIPFQTSFFTAPINGNSASGPGLELVLTVQPAERLELAASFGWNDLTMDSDVEISPGELLFAKGDRLSYSPETTASISADYEFPLGGNGYVGRLSSSANYTSKRSVRTVVGTQRTIWAGDPLTFVRAGFSVDSPNRWTATLFAENLNDEDGVPIYAIFNNPDRTVNTRPRTIGLQLEYRF